MKYLILDTSTNTASIGIGDEKEIIAHHTWDSRKNLSETLLIEIDKLLSRHSGDHRRPESDSGQAGMTRLDGIIAYLGPGSYTGLRVGITVANTLAYSLNIPIVGIKGESFGDEKFELKEMKPQDLNKLLQEGIKELEPKKSGEHLTPFYGKEPNVGK